MQTSAHAYINLMTLASEVPDCSAFFVCLSAQGLVGLVANIAQWLVLTFLEREFLLICVKVTRNQRARGGVVSSHVRTSGTLGRGVK